MAGRFILSLVFIWLFGGATMVWAANTCGEQEIPPAQLDQILSGAAGAGYLLLDLRPSADFLAGTIPGAINIGQLGGILADETHQDVDNKPVIIITETGQLDEPLRTWVKELCNTETEVWVLQGGVLGWRAAGLALENPKERLTIPGSVPFLVPRGLCELNEPAQVFD